MGSVSSLLTNMPVMSYSKDAETGVYLACNQAFAEYAGKSSPQEVVGLTDDDIFDPATAGHFVEDDKKALAMDGYAATRAIRALDDGALAKTPILAMTANAFQEDVQAALDAGMQAHIPKPIDVGLLIRELKAILKQEGQRPSHPPVRPQSGRIPDPPSDTHTLPRERLT